jgi:hypothetical protein
MLSYFRAIRQRLFDYALLKQSKIGLLFSYYVLGYRVKNQDFNQHYNAATPFSLLFKLLSWLNPQGAKDFLVQKQQETRTIFEKDSKTFLYAEKTASGDLMTEAEKPFAKRKDEALVRFKPLFESLKQEEQKGRNRLIAELEASVGDPRSIINLESLRETVNDYLQGYLRDTTASPSMFSLFHTWFQNRPSFLLKDMKFEHYLINDRKWEKFIFELFEATFLSVKEKVDTQLLQFKVNYFLSHKNQLDVKVHEISERRFEQMLAPVERSEYLIYKGKLNEMVDLVKDNNLFRQGATIYLDCLQQMQEILEEQIAIVEKAASNKDLLSSIDCCPGDWRELTELLYPARDMLKQVIECNTNTEIDASVIARNISNALDFEMTFRAEMEESWNRWAMSGSTI